MMTIQSRVIRPGPPSMTAALADILDDLKIPTRQHVAAIGRAKNLLKAGLLPGYAQGKGVTSPLSIAQYLRLKWAVFLTTCDIPPATVVRALSNCSDDDLFKIRLQLNLVSDFHDSVVVVIAALPRDPA